MGISPTLADFMAGTVGGCAGILAGQPFDTVKVRMQSRSHLYRSTAHCFVTTLRKEGVFGLYRGMLSPLAGSGPMNAVLFATYGHALRNLTGGAVPTEEAPLWAVAGAGMFGGLGQLAIITSTDLVKCQLQVQTARRGVAAPLAYAGPLDCATARVRRLGWGRGLFQGMAATALRDIPSFGLYFAGYEGMKRAFRRRLGPGYDSVASFFAGGLAGMCSWSCVYPIDVVKSVIQAAPADRPARQTAVIRVARDLYAAQGAAAFVRGLDSALLRAFPVNAATFLVYEWCLTLLRPSIA